jgi:D-Tyr-tRNAtyr deacylase
MQIRIEQYGSKIGVDGNIWEAISKKQLYLLLTIADEENKTASQFILNKTEALSLIDKINKLLNDDITEKAGFTYVE